MSMKVHELKSLSYNFEKVISGEMSFQLRRDDRKYQVGDILVLKEILKQVHDEDIYSGRIQVCKVNNILTHADGLQRGFVLLNVQLIHLHVSKEGIRYETNI